MPARITRPLTAAVLLGATTALAACSSTGTAPTALPSTHQASASPSPAGSSTAAQALAAYREMWAEVVAANQTSNYQAADLSDHLSGQALKTLTANMATEKNEGIIALGQPVLHPVVVSATSTAVAIQDCFDDSGWLQYFASTRKLVNNIPGGDRATTATVTDESGVWKVSEMQSGSDGSCHATP